MVNWTKFIKVCMRAFKNTLMHNFLKTEQELTELLVWYCSLLLNWTIKVLELFLIKVKS